MDTVSDREYGWLAGFFDGEGSVALFIRPSASKNGGPKIQPGCLFGGTEPDTFEHVKDILTRADMTYWAAWGKSRGVTKTGKPHKPAWNVNMVGLARSDAFLTWILPALVTKRERAELCRKYIASRRAHSDFRTPILASEWAIAAQMRALNSKGLGLPEDIALNHIMPSLTPEEARRRGVKGAKKRWGVGPWNLSEFAEGVT
jgi:hypothetical protein